MKQIKIGNTEFSSSALALGIMRMNKLNIDSAVKTLETAHDVGINYIDSADVYGHGKSETVFGNALKNSSLKREDFYIQSKTGIYEEPTLNYKTTRYDFSKNYIIKSVDGILSRMQIDYLDSLLLHRPDALMDPAEVGAAFDELQQDGKVRHFGVSNFNPRQVDLLQAGISQKLLINQLQFSIMHTGPIDFNIHTNMTDNRSIDHDRGIFDYSRLHQMTIQAWSPFQYGQIEGNFIGNPKFPQVNDTLEKLAKLKGCSKNAIAAAWILRYPANIQVIIGTMTPEHIIDSAKGADIELSAQEWYDLYLAAGNDLP
ncbi:aldo/keto reductase [Lactobacillus sp. ESL0236]|uniref:aldo/keto reductase n=1 Tax=unclassified Lactobacillus TaxID=2620435 RepID=UPI000EFCBD56|nr:MULTISPECIES: aldo/keto reductase [unclassified Lactobacillus]RMC41907.1 aldo/keto reductase [Lactobacillus sp. ESL0237]RMC45297.1 aldo/keto reductase [Lactobacillus sp. ESL0234]RMC46898.1 aldo/keto reductase [Lactobacillus sp. ESL0236]